MWFGGYVFGIRLDVFSDGIVGFVGWFRELVLYHNYRQY